MAAKKQYAAPELRCYGAVSELTRQNDKNNITDVPIGEPVQVGYSPVPL